MMHGQINITVTFIVIHCSFPDRQQEKKLGNTNDKLYTTSPYDSGWPVWTILTFEPVYTPYKR